MRYCPVTPRKFPGMQERSFASERHRPSDASRHERYFEQQDATGSLERKLGSLVRLVVPETEPEQDDSELARAFVQGEPWAARAIWTRHAPMVFRLLERALGPDGEADDLTQSVFLTTFDRLSSLRAPEALRSFIYSIALRLLKWELRRRRVRRIVQLSPAGVLPEVPVRAADSESREILVRFYAHLDRLGANERTAFVLRQMEGFKLEEVALHLGVSLATAKRWISRASQTVSALVAADPELSGYLGERGVFDARG
jgi:RNA polymerase sigma-70 factor (ECF subfamily)